MFFDYKLEMLYNITESCIKHILFIDLECFVSFSDTNKTDCIACDDLCIHLANIICCNSRAYYFLTYWKYIVHFSKLRDTFIGGSVSLKACCEQVLE